MFVCVQAAELYRVIEERNKMLCSLKELASRNQLQQLQVRLPHRRVKLLSASLTRLCLQSYIEMTFSDS